MYIRNSQLIAENIIIEAIRYEYIDNKPRLKIYEKSTLKLIENILSKGIEKDLQYVLNNYSNMISCLEEA